MNPYMDNILENAGSYAVYGKALGDKMRKDVVYGTDPWPKAAGGVPGIVGKDGEFDTRTSRIEQLRGEIASLEKQISDYDDEEEMGKYKFQYDADPSTYVNVQQSRRNAAATEAIRKSNEEKSDRQSVIDALKSNALELDNQRFVLAAAQRKYDEANAQRNTQAMKDAGAELNRQRAVFNRLQRDNELLRNKAAQWLYDGEVAAERIDDTAMDESMKADIESSEEFNKKQTEVGRIDSSVNNMSIPGKQKAAYVAETRKTLDRFEDEVKNSNMLEKDKRDLYDLIDKKRKELEDYARPGSKGGKKTDYVPGTLAKEMAGKTKAQIEKYSDRDLKTALAEGAKEPNFLAVLDKRGIPHD